MSSSLTFKQQSFVDKMKASAENTKWGFEALQEVPNFALFFDALLEAGFFAASNNPAPVPTEDGKYWSIPYWPALDYLERCARVSGETQQIELSKKVLDVVKGISLAIQQSAGSPDNYHTFRKFAVILGLVPTSAVDDELIAFVPIWLSSKFDRGMVASEIDRGYLKRALSSDESSDWQKACEVVRHCCSLRVVDDEKDAKAISIVDEYWLNKLLRHHAAALGKRVGNLASDLLLGRTRELFSIGNRGLSSSLYRPAVETHEQNHEWKRLENGFVEASRDVLLSWLDHDAGAARNYIQHLFQDEAEIVRRIAIYVLNEKWPLVRSVYPAAIRPNLFDYGHLHELYNLLKARFASFSDEEKRDTVEAIRQLKPPEGVEKPERSLRRMQRQWLSAIAAQGFDPADKWYADLNQDADVGTLLEHPDFSSYSEMQWGFGPTPFAATELVAFGQDGSLVTRLNSFRETGEWKGPTVRSLSDALIEAVGMAPEVLLDAVPLFLGAKRPYQYGLIAGFKRLWDSSDEKHKTANWDRVWSTLVDFIEKLLGDKSFWTEEEIISSEVLSPRRDWIVALVADFLAAGTKKDEKSYSPTLLPRTWQLILILLANANAVAAPDDDAMTQTINSQKGKAIEALINQALRECRLADQAGEKGHEETWRRLSGAFDGELLKCEDGNYEFSTLAGAYLANLEYLSRAWVEANIERIFSRQRQLNFLCAMEGLAFAPTTRSIYLLLNGKGLISHALMLRGKERTARERLIERVAIAYLWGDESLDSSTMNLIFVGRWFDDLLDMAAFFWRVSNQKLDEQREDRIRAFLRKCLQLIEGVSPPPASLLSHLSRLAVYIHALGTEEEGWLKAVAPYVGHDFSVQEFVKALTKLAPQNPGAVASILSVMVGSKIPISDYEGRVGRLLLTLAEHGQRQKAIVLADQLRSIRGMPTIFEQLSKSS